MYTMVSEIHGNVDSVLCIKDLVELETELNMKESKLKFQNRSVPLFLVNKEMVKPKERVHVDFSFCFEV